MERIKNVNVPNPIALRQGQIRVTFEFRHRPQAELALALHESGLSGDIKLPAHDQTCLDIKDRWQSYFAGLTSRFQDEAAQRTPDEEKAAAALKLLLRWSAGK